MDCDEGIEDVEDDGRNEKKHYQDSTEQYEQCSQDRDKIP